MKLLLTIFWCYSNNMCIPILSSTYDTIELCEQIGKEKIDKAKYSRSSNGHYYSCIPFMPGIDVRK